MELFESALACLIAVVLVVIAVYFAGWQRKTLLSLRTDAALAIDQRRYLLKQTWRRLFGSGLMLILAGMLVGSLFLDYSPLKADLKDLPAIEVESAKQTARVIGVYWMALLLVLMVILVLAVLDLWATARFAVQQQKQLTHEHQMALEAELARLKQRSHETN